MLNLRRAQDGLPMSLIGEKRRFQDLYKKKSSLFKVVGMRWLVCIITFIGTLWMYEELIASSQKNGNVYLAPYEVQEQYVKGGLKWVSEKAEHVGGSIARIVTEKSKGGKNLGNEAEEWKMKPYNITASSWPEYEIVLRSFSKSYLSRRLSIWSSQQLHYKIHSHADRLHPLSRIPNQILENSIKLNDIMTTSSSVEKENENFEFLFLDHASIESWVARHFENSKMFDEWQAIENPLIKHYIWRFFGMFIEGGYYMSPNGDFSKKVEEWVGNESVTVWKIEKDVKMKQMFQDPLFIIGIDETNSMDERPVKVLTGTMASQAGHPILLDTLRRLIGILEQARFRTEENIAQAYSLIQPILTSKAVLKDRQNAMENMKTWEEIKALLILDPFETEEFKLENVVDRSFTDSALSYLWIRFGLHWSTLKNLKSPLQVGDVLILPKHCFYSGQVQADREHTLSQIDKTHYSTL